MEIGLYIHIPFCQTKCSYCNFYTSVSKQYQNNYLQSIRNHLLSWKNKLPSNVLISSIYFGGGTPTLLPAEELSSLLRFIFENFPTKSNAEISIESNPDTVNKSDLSILYQAGFNRLSFGMQSIIPSELALLNRSHSKEEMALILHDAISIGFQDISLDLLLGIPEQTASSFAETLKFATQMPITHISAYMLKLEPKTILYKKAENLSFPSEDETANFYLFLVEFLKGKGFFQYEISNFAKPGFVSKHNLSYWEQKPYLGIGPSAHSYLNRSRFFYPNSTKLFIKEENPNTILQKEDDQADLWEYCMLQLRLKKGLQFEKTQEIYPEFSTWKEKIVENSIPFQKSGLCLCDLHHISFSSEGFLLSNSLTLALLEGLE